MRRRERPDSSYRCEVTIRKPIFAAAAVIPVSRCEVTVTAHDGVGNATRATSDTMVATVVWLGAQSRGDDAGTSDTAGGNNSSKTIENTSVEQVAPDTAPADGVVIPTGTDQVDGHPTGFPATDLGLFVQTGDPADVGKFRTPTLRNIALTAPYMHDGSLATLRDVVRHYSNLDEDRLHADGERILKPLGLDKYDVDSLVAFLESLSEQPAQAAPVR